MRIYAFGLFEAPNEPGVSMKISKFERGYKQDVPFAYELSSTKLCSLLVL